MIFYIWIPFSEAENAYIYPQSSALGDCLDSQLQLGAVDYKGPLSGKLPIKIVDVNTHS